MDLSLDHLAAVVARHRFDRSTPSPDDPILDELDSVAVLELVLDLQREYGVAIAGEMVNRQNFASVRTLFTMLHKMSTS